MEKKTKRTFISNSENETELLAADAARRARPGAVFALRGDLGAGKSVFARAFARELGVEGPIPSPTFTIIQEYDLPPNTAEIARLNHVDLYRIDDPDAALAFGIDERIDDPNAVSLIEWPERIEPLLPANTVEVLIQRKGDQERNIVIKHRAP
jgi:tRNA threonylcarbamoyladenosine biosynthesis protein TsaE